MKKSIVCKLSISVELDVPSETVEGSFNTEDDVSIENIVDSFNSAAVQAILSLGFDPKVSNPRHASKLHGGYSLYNTFIISEPSIQFKLLLDIRISDHPSEPDLSRRNQLRETALTDMYPELKSGRARLELLDSYCKSHGWGIQIFIGSSEYSEPVTSIEAGISILKAKLQKTVNRCMVEASNNILSKYSEDAIDLLSSYLDEAGDVSGADFNGGLTDAAGLQDYLRDLKLEYIESGEEYELFDSPKQFDEICNALIIIDKYS